MSRNEERMFGEIEAELRARGFTPLPDKSKKLNPVTPNSGNWATHLPTGSSMFYENECHYCGQPVRVLATHIDGQVTIYLQQP